MPVLKSISIMAARPNVVDAPQQKAVPAMKSRPSREPVRARHRVRAPRHRHAARERHEGPGVELRARSLPKPSPGDEHADDRLHVEQQVGERRVEKRERLREADGPERAAEDPAHDHGDGRPCARRCGAPWRRRRERASVSDEPHPVLVEDEDVGVELLAERDAPVRLEAPHRRAGDDERGTDERAQLRAPPRSSAAPTGSLEKRTSYPTLQRKPETTIQTPTPMAMRPSVPW